VVTNLILLVDLMRKSRLDQDTTALAERLSDNRSIFSGHRTLSSGRAAIFIQNLIPPFNVNTTQAKYKFSLLRLLKLHVLQRSCMYTGWSIRKVCKAINCHDFIIKSFSSFSHSFAGTLSSNQWRS